MVCLAADVKVKKFFFYYCSTQNLVRMSLPTVLIGAHLDIGLEFAFCL